jgi:hypothetical protein
MINNEYLEGIACHSDKLNINTFNLKHNKKYCLNIINSNFQDELINIPDNIISLRVKSDNYCPGYIPPNIKTIHIDNIHGNITLPNTINNIIVSDKYINNYPELLHFLPFGVKKLNIRMYGNTFISLNYLPESIEEIVIIITHYNSIDDTKNTKIELNKIYKNIKKFRIYDMSRYSKNIRITNINEIKFLYPQLEIIN